MSEPLENFNRATLAQEAQDEWPDDELNQLRYIVNQGFGKLQAAIDRINSQDKRIAELEKAFDRLPNIVNKYGLHVDELEAKYEGHTHVYLDQRRHHKTGTPDGEPQI